MSRVKVCLILLFAGVSHEILGSPLGKQDRLTVRRPSLGIINGTTASIKNYPYIVSIKYDALLLGTGVILNKHWILTSASNVVGFSIGKLTLRVGSAALSQGGQVLYAHKVKVAEDYDDAWDWDVAVIKTEKPISFGKNVQPIKLATEELSLGAKGKIAGWGTVDETMQPVRSLMETTVTVSNKTACAEVYGSFLTDRLFCTYDNQTAPSWDDSGDPLVVNGLLYGLWAGSLDETSGYYPMLFTSIPAVSEWIEKAIKS